MQLPPLLIQKFVAHLVALRDEVEALEPQLADPGPLGLQAREKLRSLSHQLAGTATPFGFPSLEEKAREVEMLAASGAPRLADQAPLLRKELAAAVERTAR